MSPDERHRAEQQLESPVPGLAVLARERLPDRDLWAGIESRIAKPGAARRREPGIWPYALAASVVMAVLLGVLLRAQPAVSTVAPVQLAWVESTPLVETSRPYGNRDGHSADAAALSPRALRLLRSESLDNAPVLVAERAEAPGFMKAAYAAGSARGQQASLQRVSQAEREVRHAFKPGRDSASLICRVGEW